MSKYPIPSQSTFSDGGLHTGRVKCFNPNKRYGFLTSDLMNEDVFFHQSNTLGIDPINLIPGLRVYFRVRLRAKGYKAYSIGISRSGQFVSGFRESRSRSEHRPTHFLSAPPISWSYQTSEPSPSLPVRHRVRRLRCYNCGQYASHKAANCPFERLTKCCYRCRDPTHLVANCPFQSLDLQQERFHSVQQPQPQRELFPLELRYQQDSRPRSLYQQHHHCQPYQQLQQQQQQQQQQQHSSQLFPMTGPSTSHHLFSRLNLDRDGASDNNKKHESVLHFL